MKRFNVGTKVRVSNPIFGKAEPNLNRVGRVLENRPIHTALGWTDRVIVSFDEHDKTGVIFFEHELIPYLEIVK